MFYLYSSLSQELEQIILFLIVFVIFLVLFVITLLLVNELNNLRVAHYHLLIIEEVRKYRKLLCL